MDAIRTAVIVEDDLATQALLAAVARRHGLTARVAGDGEAGFALILSNPPSVLIMDLVLPRISGVEMLQRMNEATPALLPRTVVVTAASDGLLHRAAPELKRVHCVMRKPIDILELGDQLLRCLDGDGGDGDGEQISPPPASYRREVKEASPSIQEMPGGASACTAGPKNSAGEADGPAGGRTGRPAPARGTR